MSIKLISVKPTDNADTKKYVALFTKDGRERRVKFGQKGAGDYTVHKDKERRNSYVARHRRDLRTKNPMKPGYLSMFLLWNKPTLEASIRDYKRRLNIYNKTGTFPIDDFLKDVGDT